MPERQDRRNRSMRHSEPLPPMGSLKIQILKNPIEPTEPLVVLEIENASVKAEMMIGWDEAVEVACAILDVLEKIETKETHNG